MTKPGCALAALSLAALLAAGTDAPKSGAVAEWPQYGNDPGGSRYSPLAEVDRSNVSRLKVAWTYHTGDISDGTRWRRKSAFEATPVLLDGTLYVATPFDRVIALDPETGRERWTFDPRIDKDVPGGDGFVCRGLATWLDPATHKRVLFLATLDARLIAIDAATGKPVAGFGTNGEVRLGDDVGWRYRGEYHITSPPAVVRDRVVVGSAIDDGGRTDMSSGVVRAFDAHSGKLAWKFDPVPKDRKDPAFATWANDSALKTGAGNAWSLLSADSERDLVFIPTGSASVDHYGGERPGDNRYTNSIVAIRGSTGQVAWHFQTVHHDLWDYDVPSQPVLVNLRRNGREVPAVISATKSALLFVLNRETGEPLFGVEERKVPASDVPGEKVSPTQPFPLWPPPLAPHFLKAGEAWGLTFWDRRGCREAIEASRSEGIFTPPSFRGTIEYPGIAGGTNWGSVAFDAGRSLVLLNATRLAFVIGLAPREKIDEVRRAHPRAEIAQQRGTPYIMWREALLSKLGVPCNPPPWGTLTAVDLSSGQVRWQETLGTIRELSPVPLPLRWGTPNMGGPMVTAGGLTFIGAAMDNYLRAFDTETGRELWKGDLPVPAQATPMTYRAREGGKQFVVICAGGHGKLTKKLGDAVVAFALP